MSVQQVQEVVKIICEDRMTVAEAREKLTRIMRAEGQTPVAAKLGFSVGQLASIARGRRNPGLQLALALEEVYAIPMETWRIRR